MTSEGEVIAFDGGSASSIEITYGTNVLEYYRDKNFQGENTLEGIQQEFAKGGSGLIKISLKERNEADRYLAYMPLGYNDSRLCYTVPVKAAQQNYKFIQEYELIFMGAFCILVLLLVLYIVYRNNKEKAVLMVSAQRDALTGLYNKENTQKAIDAILRKKEAGACHGFLIMDMDHFKEINDNYGHIAGDKALKAFGELLQKQFREQDVVGRIGGDEFVVLLSDVGSRENMEGRVQDLQDKVRVIQIEELGEKRLTFSAGISFAPEDGTSFMELYRKADNALYQSKRAGRDGYHIYVSAGSM